ncbi:MAG: helix-turn-helix domain-containing protein [Pseudonocardiaceae bacterium]
MPDQFDELVTRIEERIIWDRRTGRPRQLTLHQAVKVTLMYFKNNLTEDLIAELLVVDQSTISRAISDLKEVIADVLEEFVPDLAEEMDGRVGVVDGSLCPCWSWADSPELRSGKHTTTGHTHQFVCDLNGDLMHLSDPLPGKTPPSPTSKRGDACSPTIADHYTPTQQHSEQSAPSISSNYVSHKPPGLGADAPALAGPHNSRQWVRLSNLPNLIYTDGMSWSRYETGVCKREIVKLDGTLTECSGDLRVSTPDFEDAAAVGLRPVRPHHGTFPKDLSEVRADDRK